jgi:L-ascorbate metabolism protein UlaG (beta-lactamase superfamily)
MTISYPRLLLSTLIIFSSYFSFGQTNEIKIKFIGNCGLYMTDGESNIYIDFPYKSGAHNYMEYDKAEIDSIKDNAIFIFTHHHADHYSKNLLKNLDGQKFDPWSIPELEKLGESIAGFQIQAFKTEHKVYGISFKHYSYLITWHGKKIYISGDTGDLEDVKNLKDIDWAFVNPWLFMKAQREKITIDAKKFALYHLYPTQKVNGEIPENLLILKNQGEIIHIPFSGI